MSTISRRDLLGFIAAAVGTCAHTNLAYAYTNADYRGSQHIRLPMEVGPTAAKVTGHIPNKLRGSLFRNGPATPQGYERTPQHWFDGDGFVHGFHFTDQGVSHHGRFVTTQKLRDEQERGDLFHSGFGSVWPDTPPMDNPDNSNAANTNIIHHGNRMLALWEAGSAYELDAKTLETNGPVSWGKGLENLPFSAHPKQDRNGVLWNFGQIPWVGKTALYKVGPDGNLANFALLDTGHTGMVHDFVVTEKYLVLLIPPLFWTLDRAAAGHSFLDTHLWQPEEGTTALIIDKNNLEIVRRHQLDPGFHFHASNAFDKDDGSVELEICQSANAKILWRMHRDENDEYLTGETPDIMPDLKKIILPSGSATPVVEVMARRMEFPRISEYHIGIRHSKIWTVQMESISGLVRYVCGVNAKSGAVDRYDYGPHMIADEHIFIADPDAGDHGKRSGWLMGTYFDMAAQKTNLNIFAAHDLASGPIATAELPYGLPAGFHGNFVAA